MIKNFRFITSIAGHILPCAVLKWILKDRYPDFKSQQLQICIEAFQRSGNTFFVALFRRWNPGVAVAHHTHLASTVRKSAYLEIPTVILIRRPEEAIASIITWDPRLSASVALLCYTIFYGLLWKWRSNFLVFCFDDATNRPDFCIQCINKKFGTVFNFDAYNESVRDVIISDLYSHDTKLGRSFRESSIPNPKKTQAKLQLTSAVLKSPFLKYANKEYDRYHSISISALKDIECKNV